MGAAVRWLWLKRHRSLILIRLNKFSWKMFHNLLYACLWDIKLLFLLFSQALLATRWTESTGLLMLEFWKWIPCSSLIRLSFCVHGSSEGSPFSFSYFDSEVWQTPLFFPNLSLFYIFKWPPILLIGKKSFTSHHLG